jgi:glycosyltransferase involved in cell wall biosynthesis
VTDRSTSAVDVSVIIPTFNAAATIAEQLEALASQTFSGTWEAIVADDGSTDGTAEIVAQWVDRLPSLTILRLTSGGGAQARNVATRASNGRFVAHCDSDDVVSPNWLAALVNALQDNELATGPIDLTLLNPYRLYSWRRAPGWQELPLWMGYARPIMGCNLAVRREAFDQVGGFDAELMSGSDFDFSWRVQLAGGTVGFAADAVVHWRLRRGWSHFRRSVVYGAAQVELFRRFRSHGMPRRPLMGVCRVIGAVLGVPLVLVPKYRYAWITLTGQELGRINASVRTRTLFL